MQDWASKRTLLKAVSCGVLLAAVDVASTVAQGNHTYELSDSRLTAHFAVDHGSLHFAWVKDVADGKTLTPGEAFSVKLRAGRVVAASRMKLTSAVAEDQIAPVVTASRAAEHAAGKRLCADLAVEDVSIAVRWCAELRDGANYLRQEVTLKAATKPVDLAEVRMFDFAAPDAKVVGTVPGSPLVAGNFFFGFESPLSASEINGGHATALLTR